MIVSTPNSQIIMTGDLGKAVQTLFNEIRKEEREKRAERNREAIQIIQNSIRKSL
jgi:hypothetical protein